MNAYLTIAKREVNSFFDSLTAYVLIVVFLGLSGFFTWIYGSDIFFVGQASLQSFFAVAYWSLFFFIPALTMRSIAEEKRSGTLEFILSKPVNDFQLVTGKFIAVFELIVIALLFTLPYYITVAFLGPIDHGAVICGYFGMLLMSAVLISIGIFASSLTSNQIVAFLLALFIGVFFMVIFDVLAANFTGALGTFFSYLSLSTHYESMARGVVDSRDVIYFLSLTFLFLFSATMVLSKRNLVE
jgi:ABC-2 type transport system permease protein